MLNLCLAMLDSDDDKKSFEALYYKYRQCMYVVAYSILHNVQDAEDAVQNALIAVANNYEKIRLLSSQEVKPFLVVIVRNHSINIYNRNRRRSEYTVELDDNDAPVEIDFLEQYEYEQLLKVISDLPEIYRDIIFLHYVSGFSNKEISKLLDIKTETIWKRIERAKKLLKKALNKECESNG